jgi:hypothetical protein
MDIGKPQRVIEVAPPQEFPVEPKAPIEPVIEPEPVTDPESLPSDS